MSSKKYKKMKNFKNEERLFTEMSGLRISNFTQNEIMLKNLETHFKMMLKSYILKYYNGVFTIKYDEDTEIEKMLNFLLKIYFQKGKVGLFKLIDQYYVVDVVISRRRNNDVPYQYNISYLDEKGIYKNIYFDETYIPTKDDSYYDKRHFDYKNIKLLENKNCETILTYVNSLIELSTTIFQSIIRKLVIQNTGTIGILEQTQFKDLKRMLNQTITTANGAMTFIVGKTAGQNIQFQDINANATTQITQMQNQLSWSLDMIRTMLGMRFNSNFKLERNISNEYQQDNTVFSIFERNLKDEIQNFIKEINKNFFDGKVYLEINTKFLTNNDEDISFNGIKNFVNSAVNDFTKNNDGENNVEQ